MPESSLKNCQILRRTYWLDHVLLWKVRHIAGKSRISCKKNIKTRSGRVFPQVKQSKKDINLTVHVKFVDFAKTVERHFSTFGLKPERCLILVGPRTIASRRLLWTILWDIERAQKESDNGNKRRVPEK